jgi:hypothetical protein
MSRAGPRRVGLTVASALSLVLLASTCAKTAPPTAVGVGFNAARADKANGPGQPLISARNACGSDSATFGTELLTTSPDKATVLREWGDVVPHRQMFVSGTVRDFEFSMGDLTFDHPFGRDVVFDIKPDKPFRWLAAKVGEGEDQDGPPDGLLHTELERGLWPHQGSDYMPGFIPANGDRVAVYGRWIIDCGHGDYHTEIHPLTFFAVAKTASTATVSHAFYDPYYVTELYTPFSQLSSDFSDSSRFTHPDTKPFPLYLVAQLKNLIGIGDGPKLDHLEAHILEGANRASPITWFVCAPGGNGGAVKLSYRFSVRPGVTLTVTEHDNTGCVELKAVIGPDYTPMPLDRKDCLDPWAELNQQAQAAIGNPDLDILKAIQGQVPPQFANLVARDPTVDCYDPLAVPPPGGGAKGNTIFTDPNQPFPFYGFIKVTAG